MQTQTFDIGRVKSGWKVGVLIEADFACSISHVSLTSDAETQPVGPSEEARNFSRFSL